MNSVTLAESLGGANDFLLHFLSGVMVVLAFCAVYLRVTPYPELRMIREGKVAPALSFSGALLGFVIPVASAIAHSVSLFDMVVWSLIALVIQIAVFLVLRICFSDLSQRIAGNDPAPAVLLGVISMAAGILNAASMTF